MSVLTFGRAVSLEEKRSQLHRLGTENLGGRHSYLNTEGKQLLEREVDEDTDQTRLERQDSSPRLPDLEKREAAPLPRGFPFPPRISLLVLQPVHWGGGGGAMPLSFTDHLSLYPGW